jgi:hypothetical protein
MDFIRFYNIEDSIVDGVLEYFEENKDKMGPGSSGKDGVIGVHDDIKKSIDLVLPYYGVDHRIDSYFDSLFNAMDKYTEEFKYSNPGPYFEIVEPPNYQEYPIETGGFHLWHCENCVPPNLQARARHLVFMTYLNDIEDGGETEFFYQNLKVAPKKGNTLIWPADWTHTHRGIRSNTQIKKIITGWFSFTPTN